MITRMSDGKSSLHKYIYTSDYSEVTALNLEMGEILSVSTFLSAAPKDS